MPREHHTPSATCQEPGVAFVQGVSELIDDKKSSTEFGEFYKYCKADKSPLDEMRKDIENNMLCVLMCCCNSFPGTGSSNRVFQGCVKDILDEVNEVRKRRRKLPTSRFLAEPSINMQLNEVGRGQMNPGGPPKRSGQTLKRPDVGILKQTPVAPSSGPGTIVMDDFERFVEMKFPTESQDPKTHQEQLDAYLSWKKEVTFMTTEEPPSKLTHELFSYWVCDCNTIQEQNLLKLEKQPSIEEELERRRANAQRALENFFMFFPMGRAFRILKGIGTLARQFFA